MPLRRAIRGPNIPISVIISIGNHMKALHRNGEKGNKLFATFTLHSIAKIVRVLDASSKVCFACVNTALHLCRYEL